MAAVEYIKKLSVHRFIFSYQLAFFSKLVSMAKCLIWLFSHAVKAVQLTHLILIYFFQTSERLSYAVNLFSICCRHVLDIAIITQQ